MSLTRTDPHFALTLMGTVCGLPMLAPQYPRLMGEMLTLAEIMARADGGGDLLRALDAEPEVAISVTDGDAGTEARALTGSGLLLDGHDLHDLVLQDTRLASAGEEEVNDLVLLDGQGEEEDLLKALELAVLHEAAKLGDGLPLALAITASTSTSASTSASTSTATSTSAATSKSSAFALSFSHSSSEILLRRRVAVVVRYSCSCVCLCL